jgi:hypothetical protein
MGSLGVPGGEKQQRDPSMGQESIMQAIILALLQRRPVRRRTAR